MKSRFLQLAILLAFVCTASAQSERVYKWTDEDGNVHYSDQIPFEDLQHAREELNKDAIVVNRVERAKTADEIAAERERRIAEREAAERAEREKARRRKLLATYASEEDIERVKQTQVDGIDRTIAMTEALIASQTQHLASMVEQAAEIERRGDAIEPALAEAIREAREQLREHEEVIERKQSERERTIELYNNEIERYREALARVNS